MSAEKPWDDPRITAYVLGDLSEEARKQFESDLEDNAELVAAVEEARGVTDRLHKLYAAEPTATLDQERRHEITAQQTRSSSSGVQLDQEQGGAPSKFVWIALATAACLLLLVGVAPMLRHLQIVTQAPTDGNIVDSVERSVDASGATVDARPSDEVAQATPMMDMTEEAAEIESHASPGSSRAAGLPDLSADSEVDSAPAPDTPTAPAAGAFDGDASGSSPSMAARGLGRTETSRGGRAITPEPEIMEMQASQPSPPSNSAGPAGSASAPVASRTRESASSPLPPRDASIGNARFNQAAGSAAPAAGPAPVADTASPRRRSNAAVDNFGGFGGGGSALGLEAKQKPSESQIDYGDAIAEGRGPGISGDQFDPITDNAFRRVSEHPFSTFSVDVDTASYSKVRDFLVRAGQLPRPDAVRIEEMLNYFDYDYTPPAADDPHPFTAHTVVTGCPWNEDHRLARIALKGKTMEKEDRPPCNLVFLLDTSGSMNAPNKLPLVIDGMKMLIEQLNEKDTVAITVYAGSAGLVLDPTPANKLKKIRNALTQLAAGGSTNGGAGIALAYQTARENFVQEGVNRVILCTDGDFNVGTTGTDELVRMVEREAKGGVFLTVLGFGMGNHNDAMLEQISGRGNGNYAFIDTPLEARKVLVEQTSGTLVTIAKDVKLQIEFNPQQVSSYRLIGYENRVLAKEDFNDDKKDAGEIGAGHSVTALYELVPAGIEADASKPEVDDLKYQRQPELTDAANSNELMTLKLRYKQPDGDTSTLVEFPVVDDDLQFDRSDDHVRFAAAVASFGMQLRRSPYAGSWTMADVLEVAQSAKGDDASGLRSEFIELVRIAKQLMGQE